MEGVARAERRRSPDVISADIAVSQAGVIIGGGMRTTARVHRGGHGRQAPGLAARRRPRLPCLGVPQTVHQQPLPAMMIRAVTQLLQSGRQ